MDDPRKTFSVRVLTVLLGFFLLFIVKCERKEDKLKNELLTQKEPRLVSLENCQPLKMGENAKTKKWLLGTDQIHALPDSHDIKMKLFGSMAVKSFAETLGRSSVMTQRASQPATRASRNLVVLSSSNLSRKSK